MIESAEVYNGAFIDELYRRLMERYYAQHDSEVQILAAELTNREDLLMLAYGEHWVLDSSACNEVEKWSTLSEWFGERAPVVYCKNLLARREASNSKASARLAEKTSSLKSRDV